MRQRNELCFEQALQEALGFGGILPIVTQRLDERPLSRDVLVDFRQVMLRLLEMLVSQSHGRTTPIGLLHCMCEMRACAAKHPYSRDRSFMVAE